MMEDGKNIFGYWWLPTENDNVQYQGNLRFNSAEGYELEIYEPADSQLWTTKTSLQGKIPILLGNCYRLGPITLFCVQFHQQTSGYGTCDVYKVDKVLIGKHVTDTNVNIFTQANIRFPNLNKWVCANRLNVNFGEKIQANANFQEPAVIKSVDIEENLSVQLLSSIAWKGLKYKVEFNEDTLLAFKGSLSIQRIEELMYEYSQFLSVVRQCQQIADKIILYDDNPQNTYYLEINTHRKNDNSTDGLIRYEELGERIETYITNWHKRYELIKPIVTNYIYGLQYKEIIEPIDFVIVAESIEGYFKRFVNKLDGKDNQKFGEEVQKLLDKFKGVDILDKCAINPIVVKDTRDTYVHLYDEKENEEKRRKAVGLSGLEDLTYRCRIFLTCCIMDYMGLTIDEMNMCFNQTSMAYYVQKRTAIY